jgi:histidine triad (HIT) family protein
VGLVIAGFDVPHTHVHLIPVHDYHDITSRAFAAGPPPAAPDAELAAMAARLRSTAQGGALS